MAFGYIMRLTVGELEIELAPFTRESMAALIAPGMQQASVTKYLGRTAAPTLEDEHEWYDRVRTSDSCMVWGIWILDGTRRALIGTTSLNRITKGHVIQAVTGSAIVDRAYWGRGIASAIHKARTWYAFEHQGMHRLTSAVIHGNVASRRALEKTGYSLVYTERNEKFVDGELRHMDHLECLNPVDWVWRQWWHGDTPPIRARAARQRTRDALDWAAAHVTLL